MFDIRDHGGKFGGGGGVTKGAIFPLKTFGLPLIEKRLGSSFQNTFFPQRNLSNKKLAMLTLPGSTGSGFSIYDDGKHTGLTYFNNAVKGCIPLSDGRYVLIHSPSIAYIRDSNMGVITAFQNFISVGAGSSTFNVAYEVNGKLVLISAFLYCSIINLDTWTLAFEGYLPGRTSAFEGMSNVGGSSWDIANGMAYAFIFNNSYPNNGVYRVKIQLNEMPSMTFSHIVASNVYNRIAVKPDGSEIYAWNANSYKCEVWNTSTWVKIREFSLEYQLGSTAVISTAPGISMLKYLKSENALLLVTSSGSVLINPITGKVISSLGKLSTNIEIAYPIQRIDEYSKKDDRFYAVGSYSENSNYFREFITIAASIKAE